MMPAMRKTRRSAAVFASCLTIAFVFTALLPDVATAAKTESQMSGNVAGVVMLNASDTLTGARVTLIPAGAVHRKNVTRRSTVSVEGGRFNLSAPAGKYVLRVAKDGVGEREVKVEIKEHETTNVTVRMDEKKKDKDDEKKDKKE
jgi:hypothetical protein